MTGQAIEPGASATVRLEVARPDTAIAMGSGDLEVLATPRVVALVEEAAVLAVAPGIEENSTSVGTRIDMRHLAPSPVGSSVAATATVTAVDGRRISFEVEAIMGSLVVATGSHDRVIVDREKFLSLR